MIFSYFSIFFLFLPLISSRFSLSPPLFFGRPTELEAGEVEATWDSERSGWIKEWGSGAVRLVREFVKSMWVRGVFLHGISVLGVENS